MARDYDGDGDLDIAAISFFADYASPQEEGFVYLKNEGNFNSNRLPFLKAKWAAGSPWMLATWMEMEK
jgi:hypothetical protein